MPYVQLPNGRDLEIPEGMDYESAMNAAKQQFPDAFGIQVKHGGWEAAKHGFKQSLEYGLRGIGSLTGTELTPTAEKIFAPDTSPEAYRPTTSENTALAFEKGVLPGIGSAISQHVTEPFAGAMSSYAIPMAYSAAATALGGPVAGGAAFTALAAPGEIQQNIEEQQRVRPGQAPDMTKAIMGGLVQAALLPVLGAAGGVVKNAVLKAIAPELATLTKAVASGAMAEEVAVASLQSRATNLMIHTAEMGAVGVPLMAGTEAIRMGQAGEDLTSPEAVGRMGEATKAAIMGAPLFGVVGGMGVRGAQERQLKAAGEGYTGQWNEAHAINKPLVEQASLDRVQAAEQQAKDEQQAAIPQGAQMGLEIPGQPLSGQAETLSVRLARVQQELDQLTTTRGAQVKAGMPPEDIKQTAAAIKQKKQELNYTKSALGKSRLAGEVEEAPTVAPTITRADFNEMGIPNDKAGKELRAYEGVAAGSPEMGELRDKLASLIDPEGENTPKWMTEEKAAKISEKLKSPLMLGEQQGLGLELPSNEAMQASMHEGRWQDRAQKMQTAAAAARAQKGAMNAKQPSTEDAAAMKRDAEAYRAQIKEKVDAQAPETKQVETQPAQAPTAGAVEQQPATPSLTPGGAVDAAVASAHPWDTANRTRRHDEWFYGAKINEDARNGFNEALVNGGDTLQAHGMAKESTLTGAIRNLTNLLQNGLDANRNKGWLHTAPLVNKPGEGLVGATTSGSAYSDGAFMLVARPGESISGNLSGVGAILVNQAHADIISEITSAIHSIRPDITVALYSEAGKVSKSLTKESQQALQKQEAARAQKGADKTANTQGSAVQKVGQVQDMFNERNKAPYTTPAEAPVAPTPTDVQAKTAELSRQFNRAYKAHMQDPTDAVKRAELDRVLSIARQGTLFEEKPSEITEPGAPKPGADRTSAAVPAQASPRPEPGAGARPVKQGVARAVVPVEQPVVGEKPGVSALEKREAEAAATRDLKQENAEKLESKKRVADDRTKPAPVDKGWGAMEAPKLTPEEQAARDKATGPIGTNEAQTIGPTGIGGAAKASTVKEYTPAHTPLAEVSKGAGAKAAARLWWNDLDDMQTSKTDIAKEALAKGIAAGHITPEHLARAADIAAADRAQQVRLKNAQAARHEAKVAADKALNKQVAEITETAKTTHKQKVKAEAGLEEPKETGTESLNRISKEYAESTGEVDPDVAQVEHLLAALEPGMKVSLEVEGSNGEAKTIKHDAKKAIRAADRAAKNAESMLGCVLK